MEVALRGSKAVHPAVLQDPKRHSIVMKFMDIVLDAQIDQWANGSYNAMSLAALATEHSKRDAAEALYEGLQVQAELL